MHYAVFCSYISVGVFLPTSHWIPMNNSSCERTAQGNIHAENLCEIQDLHFSAISTNTCTLSFLLSRLCKSIILKHLCSLGFDINWLVLSALVYWLFLYKGIEHIYKQIIWSGGTFAFSLLPVEVFIAGLCNRSTLRNVLVGTRKCSLRKDSRDKCCSRQVDLRSCLSIMFECNAHLIFVCNLHTNT